MDRWQSYTQFSSIMNDFLFKENKIGPPYSGTGKSGSCICSYRDPELAIRSGLLDLCSNLIQLAIHCAQPDWLKKATLYKAETGLQVYLISASWEKWKSSMVTAAAAAAAKSLQSCPTLSDPMDRSLPGSSTHGIFQARVLEWDAIAFPSMVTERMAKCRA